MKFDGTKLSVSLVPQSPMIHFQWKQEGCTLRASEVKPKLDRYIIERLGGETEARKKCPMIFQSEEATRNKNGEIVYKKKALDYRMTIVVEDTTTTKMTFPNGRDEDWEVRVNENKGYKFYYGNMGKNSVKKKSVWTWPKLTIICFKEEMRKLLENYLHSFFLVTNFGTSQNKGFGSFVIESEETSEETIARELRATY